MNLEKLNVEELSSEELVETTGGADGRSAWYPASFAVDCADAWIAAQPEAPR